MLHPDSPVLSFYPAPFDFTRLRRYPVCMACSRRSWFARVAGGLTASQLALNAQVASKTERSKLAMPGLYRGRVVAVEHPKSIVSGTFQAEPIQQMIQHRNDETHRRAGYQEPPGANFRTW